MGFCVWEQLSLLEDIILFVDFPFSLPYHSNHNDLRVLKQDLSICLGRDSMQYVLNKTAELPLMVAWPFLIGGEGGQDEKNQTYHGF